MRYGNLCVTVVVRYPDGNMPASSAFNGVEGDPFDALADPHRRAILGILRQGEQPVQVMADQMPISRPAVSRHLRVLKQAGLVTDRAQGTRRLYRLDDPGLEAVRRYLDDIWGDAIRRFTLFAQNTAPASTTSEETDR